MKAIVDGPLVETVQELSITVYEVIELAPANPLIDGQVAGRQKERLRYKRNISKGAWYLQRESAVEPLHIDINHNRARIGSSLAYINAKLSNPQIVEWKGILPQ